MFHRQVETSEQGCTSAFNCTGSAQIVELPTAFTCYIFYSNAIEHPQRPARKAILLKQPQPCSHLLLCWGQFLVMILS